MKILLFALFNILTVYHLLAQTILPTPMEIIKRDSFFRFTDSISVSWNNKGENEARYFEEKFPTEKIVYTKNDSQANLFFNTIENKTLGDEGYRLEVLSHQIIISANNEAGFFYGLQSLFFLMPNVVLDPGISLFNVRIFCQEITDKPKYPWRSFMLDSGRQYQSPAFIKKYLDRMAMLKMNTFHWHLTEKLGWRLEIKRYPKLTSIGSNVAIGPEQQGFYTQKQIRDIIAYAKKLHIQVVPEIDVPGHANAALTAYPELTCFNKMPEKGDEYHSTLFCGGNEKTYEFLENILDEVCELFPSEYIHLGGDEAPKANWDKCPLCQKKIKKENLKDSHELQLYFSKRLANYLRLKGKKAIFWGDVVYSDGITLPDNVVIYWWNWNGHEDKALKNALARGHQVICGTNFGTYLNYPIEPWGHYGKNRTFDLRQTYDENPSDLKNPNPLVLGMGTSLWTDWNVREHMIDQRVFPRIFSLAEQMWHVGEKIPYNEFYMRVKLKRSFMKLMGIKYGPAIFPEIPENYSWE